MTTGLSEAQKESLREEAKLGRGTRAERETLRRETRGVKEKREGEELFGEGESYLSWLQQNLNQLIETGAITEEEALRSWAAETTYLQGFGVTPELRGFEAWQEAIEIPRRKEEQYENIKSAYLASTDMSFSEKFTALLRLHPDSGRTDVARQIRSDVIGSLTEKDIDPGIVRQYKSLYEKSVTDRPYAQWLIYQGLATPEGRSGGGDGVSRRLTRGPTTRPEAFPFEPAFEEERARLGGPQIWKNWFEDRFGLQIRRFKGQVEDQTEETWATFLKKQTPKLREEWWKVGAFRRGERPSAQQPRIRTVRF